MLVGLMTKCRQITQPAPAGSLLQGSSDKPQSRLCVTLDVSEWRSGLAMEEPRFLRCNSAG